MSIIQCGISSPEIKLARELNLNKLNSDLFICEGLWAAEKLISRSLHITHFFFNSEKDYSNNPVFTLLCKHAENVCSISSKACQKISDRDGADDFYIIARQNITDVSNIQIPDNTVILILDGQEQPGNVGAMLRSLDCAGGTSAIMTNTRVKFNNSRLVRSSLGASFMLNVFNMQISDTIKFLSDNRFKIVLTDLTAVQSYRDVNYSGRIAIVAGNEHTGISPVWRTLDNALPVIIPMRGSCESLNVGFASTLVAYEACNYQIERGLC